MNSPFEFKPAPINSFRGKYRFLSNFWPVEVVLDGFAYPSTEHAYQAAKTTDPAMREMVRGAYSAGVAKQLGKNMVIRADWTEALRIAVMTDLLAQKFQHAELADMLLATGDAPLIEGNSWHDVFWGTCSCAKHGNEGSNHLGRLLMEVRSTLSSQGIGGLEQFRTTLAVPCGE